jgi:hypothetical protein
MIEEYSFVTILKGRGDEAPHILIAPIAMGKKHRLLPSPEDLNIVSLENGRHGCSVQSEIDRKRPLNKAAQTSFAVLMPHLDELALFSTQGSHGYCTLANLPWTSRSRVRSIVFDVRIGHESPLTVNPGSFGDAHFEDPPTAPATHAQHDRRDPLRFGSHSIIG